MAGEPRRTQRAISSQQDSSEIWYTKEMANLIGACVMFLCSILALINLIGGIKFPLWLQVPWEMASIICAIIVLIRAYVVSTEGNDEMVALGMFLTIGVFIGGLIGVIGSFWIQEFLSGLTLALFVLMTLFFIADVRR